MNNKVIKMSHDWLEVNAMIMAPAFGKGIDQYTVSIIGDGAFGICIVTGTGDSQGLGSAPWVRGGHGCTTGWK